MKHLLIYLSIALVLGFTIGTQFNLGQDNQDNNQPVAENDSPAIQPASPNNKAAPIDLTSFEQRLQEETEARQKLERQIALISEQLKDFEQRLNFDSELEPETIDDSQEVSESRQQNGPWFNERALIDSGMDATQARMLKDFFERQELQQLYLRDQSIRESWDRARRREAFGALADEESAFLEQLDESDYEAYLYASGQPNRVAISSVLDSAQAGAAGIEAGDHVLRYDNQRIYNGFDLRQATSSGTIGDTVMIEVERDGKIMEFYLERGPLGVRLDSMSVAPEN